MPSQFLRLYTDSKEVYSHHVYKKVPVTLYWTNFFAKPDTKPLQCFKCQGLGHVVFDCPSNEAKCLNERHTSAHKRKGGAKAIHPHTHRQLHDRTQRPLGQQWRRRCMPHRPSKHLPHHHHRPRIHRNRVGNNQVTRLHQEETRPPRHRPLQPPSNQHQRHVPQLPPLLQRALACSRRPQRAPLSLAQRKHKQFRQRHLPATQQKQADHPQQ